MRTQRYAGLWVRVAAFAFDYIPIAGYLVLVVALGSALNAHLPDVADQVFSNPIAGQGAGFLLVTLPVSVYFVLLESSRWQATWGKRRMQLRVVGVDGTRLSRARSVSRTALKFMPWELAHTCIWQISVAPQEPSPLITAGFAAVWLLVGANALSLMVRRTRQTLYDHIAGTLVVST
jgi:uncharacterized RDD family membrane protein YckC